MPSWNIGAQSSTSIWQSFTQLTCKHRSFRSVVTINFNSFNW